MSRIPESAIVLDHQRISLIIERFAHEIYELHHDKKDLVLVGISGHGFEVATRVFSHLTKISDQAITLHSITMDKLAPTDHPIVVSTELDTLRGSAVILIDDVLNSGLTLVHALRHLLSVPVGSVTTAVLVDRIHRRYPVRADIVGLSLSTTLQERVEVELGKKDYAYLI